MRQILSQKVRAAIGQAHQAGDVVSPDLPAGLTIEVPKVASHGDWSTNAALVMAKTEKKKPRLLADILIGHIDNSEGYIERIEVAGPGFINFILSRKWWENVVREVLRQGQTYGHSDQGRGIKVQVEFVSANPTGPLHVGHGRGAAVGDALARVLSAAGYQVEKEYYVNDAGRQMQTLGLSVLYRYLEMSGRPVDFHQDLYQGGYIRDLAAELREQDNEKYLDMPDQEAATLIYPWAAARILAGIKEDLRAFGVTYNVWFSEKSLFEQGAVERTLIALKNKNNLYENGGALWFAATRFGDEKDRVLIKSNGDKTYFASDIAYHYDKYQRGFDLVINLWGADHHGYVPRMKSAVQAMGFKPEQLEILLVQLVNLLRGGEPVAMSTRAGEFVPLKDVVDEVGVDAARFFFLTRSSDSHLDFDLEVAKSQSSENPVYYIQYAHARIASVFKTAAAEGLPKPGPKDGDLSLLVEEEALSIIKLLAAYPDLIAGAAAAHEPHRLTHYLTDLAKRFHPYYNRHRFVSPDKELSTARLVLARAVQLVIANGLTLLGISAPDKM